MNKRTFIFVLSVFICLVGCTQATVAPKKPWTVFVYLAADNTLSSFASINIGQMQKVGSNAHANVIVYYSSNLPGQGKKSSKMVINKGSSTTLSSTPNLDSGSVQTFQDALSWACSDFPSDHLMVIMWDHGSGTLNPGRSMDWFRGMCWDDSTGNYLTDRDVVTALDYVIKKYRGGKKIDILGCDACMMGAVEFGATLEPYVNYLVASEETIPGDGYPYDGVLAPFTKGVPQPVDLAKNIVSAYGNYYKNSGEDYTLAAIDLSKLDPLVAHMNQISQFFATQLKSNGSAAVKKGLTGTVSANAALHYGGEDYVDLNQWLNNTIAAIPVMKLSAPNATTITNLLKATLPLVKTPILARVYGFHANYSHSNGLSVYLPSTYVDPSYDNILWTQGTQWANFLHAFTGS